MEQGRTGPPVAPDSGNGLWGQEARIEMGPPPRFLSAPRRITLDCGYRKISYLHTLLASQARDKRRPLLHFQLPNFAQVPLIGSRISLKLQGVESTKYSF